MACPITYGGHNKYKKTVRVKKTNMHHHAKIGVDRSNRCRCIAIFRFFNMAAILYLGFIKVRNFNRP